MIQLGSKVKDTLTGFTGIATARAEFLYGCTRICIEPQDLKDGVPIEAKYFDEQRVEVIEERKPEVSKASSATTGGPYGNPQRAPDPA